MARDDEDFLLNQRRVESAAGATKAFTKVMPTIAQR